MTSVYDNAEYVLAVAARYLSSERDKPDMAYSRTRGYRMTPVNGVRKIYHELREWYNTPDSARDTDLCANRLETALCSVGAEWDIDW